MSIWHQRWWGRRKKWTLHSIVQKLIDKETNQRKNGCKIQLVHANISCNVWCGCSVPQLPGHSASVSVAFIVHTFLTVWMYNVTVGEGTFGPRDVGRRLARWKADSSRLALLPFWSKPQRILSAMKWSWCLWHWASPPLLQQLTFGPLADTNAELQLSSSCQTVL